MDDLGMDMDAELTGCEREVARLEKEISNLQDDLRDTKIERWRIWEDGFKEGMKSIYGLPGKNPYTPPIVAKLEGK
jgi:hypothetical protein